MTKNCPIMSFQRAPGGYVCCLKKECAFWDEEKGQCCIKTMALAAAAKPSGSSNTPISDYAVFPPVSTGPAVIPGGSGEPYKHPYTITCDLGEIVQ